MEEEEAKKMVALKKAYAEIILNTAKEAAERVMVSERTARRFQQDLFATKDEALRMLVRLKQMIDSKTTEAEIISISQQRKIEELEAQLQEAEEIITDLRIELKQVQDELGKVKKNQVQPLSVRIAKEDVSSAKNETVEAKLNTSEPISYSPGSGLETAASSDLKNTHLNQRIVNNKSCNLRTQTEEISVSHLENYYGQNSDLASMIMRNKKPELYKNGCTQRIRAFGRNLLDAKLLPPGDVDDQHSLTNSQVSDKDEGKCTAPSYKIRDITMIKNSCGEDIKKTVKTRTLRKRKTRFGKRKASSCSSRPSQLTRPSQPSALSRCKTYSVNGNAKSDREGCTVPFPNAHSVNMVKESTQLEETLEHNSNCYKDEVVKIVCKGKRKRKKVRCREAIATSFRSLDHLVESCQLINGNVNSAENQLNTAKIDAKMKKPLPRLDPGLTLFKSSVDPISGSTNSTVSKAGLVQNPADSTRELRDESMLVKQEGDTAESSKVPSPELNIDMVDALLACSEAKDAKASSIQADNNRLITYTSRKKRKKEDSLYKPDEEASPVNRRIEEKQNNAPEPQKSNLINESSRDSRRLAQVARQLISLSGKRW